MKYDVPEKMRELGAIFSSHSYSLYLVGGAVRDYLLRRKNDDYDLTTSALPGEVKAMFRRTIDTGIKHGTVTVIYKGGHYEITTFRTEGDYSDSRHPDSVTFVRSLEEDLKRRDFTINALAAGERIREDALRMLRACRFSAKLGFDIEEKTLSAIKERHGAIGKVSIERIKEELDKLLLSPYPVKGLRYMEETGLLGAVIPELTLTDATISSIERAKEESLPLPPLYAVLFSSLAADRVQNVLTRLRSSNREKEEVVHIVRSLGYDERKSTPYDARLFIHDNGSAIIPAIFAVRRAVTPFSEDDEKFAAAVENEMAKKSPTEIKDLAVTGEDLASIVPKGPGMGRMLNYLLERVIENPELNTKEKLLALAAEANPCS